ncbi:hypothetical protein [Actinoplanes rectilineatus]|uniref:hypothetical protein n=1 Tax=Actinoplanes rectilineatus TaxID=113571 RepID=UPI001B80DC03|nr:hypothetical protein [Actinoplanes rectilineatus]
MVPASQSAGRSASQSAGRLVGRRSASQPAGRPVGQPAGTPTGSSWINQVERWFGFLIDQKIRRGVHKSVQALEADIRDWVTDWNANPRPFIWTKTAEEFLESIARFCDRVSGAGH